MMRPGIQVKVVVPGDGHHGQIGRIYEVFADDVIVKFANDPEPYAYRHSELTLVVARRQVPRSSPVQPRRAAPHAGPAMPPSLEADGAHEQRRSVPRGVDAARLEGQRRQDARRHVPADPPTGGAARGGFKRAWMDLSDAHRGWIVIGVIAATIAVVVAVAVGVSNRRDLPSYHAGFEDGTSFARTYTSLTSDLMPELNIRISCSQKALMARDGGVWWSGGRIPGEDLNEDDYKEGCIEAVRSLVPS